MSKTWRQNQVVSLIGKILLIMTFKILVKIPFWSMRLTCFKRHVSVYSTLLHLWWNIKYIQSRFDQCLVLIPLRVAADKNSYCQAGHLHCGAAEEVSFTQCPLTQRNKSIRYVRIGILVWKAHHYSPKLATNWSLVMEGLGSFTDRSIEMWAV